MSLGIFGALLGGKFFSAFALTLILQQVAITGIVGAAQTLVVITAGIDLSVGAIMVLSSVVMGQFTFRYGLPVELSILCGLVVGTLCGMANGWLIARIKLPPFIVTLGMWQIVLAANFLYSRNETIRAQEIGATAPLLQVFGDNFRLGGAVFTYGVIALVVLVALLWYGLSVLICAFAGWVLIGRIGSVSPTAGQFANIESITAVVIGGISLFGGRGSILGMLFGALIVGVFALGLRLLGTDVQWTYLLIGTLIIAAVAIDQWIRKAAS